MTPETPALCTGGMFTFEYYRNFLKKAVECAPVVSLGMASALRKYIILRHDVDFSVEYAYELFLVEKEYEVRSSFFLMVSSGLYNVMAEENRAMLREISDAGFEIGLHFDPSVYGNVPENALHEKMRLEASVLAEACGNAISSISLHNPSVHGNYIEFSGMNNAYAGEFFKKETYYSDSCMNAYGKNLFEFIKMHGGSNPQITNPSLSMGQ